MPRPTLDQLEPVARAALAEYGLAVRELQSLKYYNNATYRVVATDGAEYALRVTSNYYGEAELRSEMQWLSAMQGERDVRLPNPEHASGGSFVVRATSKALPEPRLCVLCRWTPGTHCREESLGANELARLGRATGLLHRKSAAFAAPPDFARPRWDESRFLDANDGGAYARVLEYLGGHFSNPAIARVRVMTDELRETMRLRGGDPASFGLVHGDFHAGNYLFDDGAVGFIDFEDLGWGDYLYDVGTALFGVLEQREYPRLVASFAEAYAEMFGLPDDLERKLRSFQLFRALFLTHIAVIREDPAENAWWRGYVLGKFQRLLA